MQWPQVPIVFCETRPLAEEWTFRFLGAARAALQSERDADQRLDGLVSLAPVDRPASR